MSKHVARISWARGEQPFTDNKYSRAHEWAFDGGGIVPASSSPHVVPLPFSVAGHVDPEEAFVASLSSCHMLWFLSIAAQAGYIVDTYVDTAEGLMEKDANGRFSITRVTLRPDITWHGEKRPTGGDIAAMHDKAHDKCFIANSVKTKVVVAGSSAL